MSENPPRDENEADLIAAEYALGLLAGEELRAARRRAASDHGFAANVARWEARLAPLAEEIRPIEPDPAVWERVRGVITALARDENNVVPFARSRERWRAAAVAMTAIAASLALIVGYQASREPPAVMNPVAPDARPVLIASLSSEREATALSVAYDARESMLLVTPGRIAVQTGRAHELWIIPVGGTPVSLGLVEPGEPVRRRLQPDAARHFRAAATMAVSVEPAGGSPTGLPTGPVVASGPLVTI